MAAPQIPDLRTLRSQHPPRRGRGGGERGRGRGRGIPSSASLGQGSAPTPSPRWDQDVDNDSHEVNGVVVGDQIVQRTDVDASLSRVSAVEAGYLDDPFATLFLDGTENTARKLPIINRGTFVRSHAIDSLVHRFLQDGNEASTTPPLHRTPKRQIVSLGAGSDTRWFRLVSRTPSLMRSLVYHEVDFAANTARKIESIQQSDALFSLLRSSCQQSPDGTQLEISGSRIRLLSPGYNVHPIDLRSLPHPSCAPPYEETDATADQGRSTGADRLADHNILIFPLFPNLDPTIPTLFISECCLVYLSPSEADKVLQYFTSPSIFPRSTPLGIVLYEPTRPHDAFGREMVKNLSRRGIVLQTLQRYGSLRQQRERLRRMGFDTGQGAADVDFIHDRWVDEHDRQRVSALELLDEVEEWRLLAKHYCVAWAWRELPPSRHARKKMRGDTAVSGSGEASDDNDDDDDDDDDDAQTGIFASWEKTIVQQPPSQNADDS
ncbi:MAG: carboxy methyl transferase for protein phosphatase 2A [Lichina confinis]|nr:MAG: carboxy methyl transferase for protein phosphatase 2A [Lichina confinis]